MSDDDALNIFPGEYHGLGASFALVGEYITTYQQIEDYLPRLFATALAIDAERSYAIFDCVRGLEAKLDLITAAFLKHEKEYQDVWAGLLKKVTKCAEARNQIAHGRPFAIGRLRVENKPEGIYVFQQRTDFQVRKSTKKNDIIWTDDLIRKQLHQAVDTFHRLIAFTEQCPIVSVGAAPEIASNTGASQQ